MARYDEDLHENLFFNTLVSKYGILFSEAAEKKRMVSESNAPRPYTGSKLAENERGRGEIKALYTQCMCVCVCTLHWRAGSLGERPLCTLMPHSLPPADICASSRHCVSSQTEQDGF